MTPFANPQVEICLLASFLEYPDTYHQAKALGLTPDCFCVEQNRSLFRLVEQAGETGNHFSYESLLSELRKEPGGGKLQPVLEELTNPLHMPKKTVEWHVEKLKNIAKRTRLIAECRRAITAAEDPAQETNSCLSELLERLINVHCQADALQPTLVKDFIGGVVREIELRSQQTGLIGLPTGLAELDKATTGIRAGELWVIGATPGCGKTALGTQIALASARAGNPAAIFSLEMTQQDLGARLLANESAVSASQIRNPKYIQAHQWRELAQWTAELCKLPLHVDETPSLTIQEVVARARRFVRQHKCQLIVVDYIRLIKAPGKELREQVGNITDALRQLAKSEKVGVVALSQLARPSSKSVNTRPSMLRLKESGDIEAHAHVVLLIHMPMKSNKPTGEDEIIIAKSRHGPTGKIDVTFSRDRLKFLPRLNEEASGPEAPLLIQTEQEGAGQKCPPG